MKIILLVVLFFCSNALLATDMGVIGTTYPVIERSLITVFQERMAQKIKSGKIDNIHANMLDNSKKYVHRPPGLTLPRAQQYKAIEIHPSYRLQQDIVDADGKVLFMAGAQVNPLEIYPLTKALCFIDGDDQEQVLWLMQYCTANPKNKLILVKGNYLEISEQTRLRMYFDQKGFLVKKFGISALPAIIRQNGHVLYVEQFPM